MSDMRNCDCRCGCALQVLGGTCSLCALGRCDEAKLRRHLAAVHKERDALAAAVEQARKWIKEQYAYWYACVQYDEGTGDPDLIPERKVQIEAAKAIIKDRTGKAILAAHDRAKDAEIAGLVDALREVQAILPNENSEEYVEVLSSKAHRPRWFAVRKQVDAALARYKCRTCDGSETVFDDPSAPCPACVTKEVPDAAKG